MSSALRSIVAACLSGLLLAGCGGKQKQRATVQFHARGVRQAITNLRQEVNRPQQPARPNPQAPPQNPYYRMKNATEQLSRALRGLPARIESTAQTRKQERTAAAEKAKQLFKAYQPVLESLRYDKAEATAKLDELEKLIAQVEQP